METFIQGIQYYRKRLGFQPQVSNHVVFGNATMLKVTDSFTESRESESCSTSPPLPFPSPLAFQLQGSSRAVAFGQLARLYLHFELQVQVLVVGDLKVGQRVDLVDEGVKWQRQLKKSWVRVLTVGRLGAAVRLVSGRLPMARELMTIPHWKWYEGSLVNGEIELSHSKRGRGATPRPLVEDIQNSHVGQFFSVHFESPLS